jgi:hypothetical protein
MPMKEWSGRHYKSLSKDYFDVTTQTRFIQSIFAPFKDLTIYASDSVIFNRWWGLMTIEERDQCLASIGVV